MEKISENNLLAALEAVLFVYGEPLEIKKLSKILNVSEEEIRTAVSELSKILDNQNRGLALIVDDSRAQIATKPEFSSLIENFIKSEFDENLTPAALETLSLVAYLGPLSRPQIDYYRGVNSSFTVRNLLMKGLVERFNKPDNQHLFFYKPSMDLLKYLGVSKIEDLPDFEKYKTLSVENIQNSQPGVN